MDNNFPLYVVTVTLCESCGGEQRVALFPDKPTEDQIYSVSYGATCEDINVIKVEGFEEVFNNEEIEF